MVFPVVMYGCESWTVKKAEHRRIDAFDLWCWRRLLRVPWTARRSNQSILKEISPGISLEGMMLKLKLQYFGHLTWRVDSLEKTLMLGGTGGRRRRGRQDEMAGWHHWLDGHGFRWTPGVGDGQGGLVCCDSWGRKESDTTERLNWTEKLLILFQVWMEVHAMISSRKDRKMSCILYRSSSWYEENESSGSRGRNKWRKGDHVIRARHWNVLNLGKSRRDQTQGYTLETKQKLGLLWFDPRLES